MNKGPQLEVAYIFNEQFTYLARTVFGNPTLNLCFKFLKRFSIFYFCRDFFPEFWTYRRSRFNAILFSIWYATATFRMIPQIKRYIIKFKNSFHQFWGYSSFKFQNLSHQFFADFVGVRLQSCLSVVILQRMSQNLYILLVRPKIH